MPECIKMSLAVLGVNLRVWTRGVMVQVPAHFFLHGSTSHILFVAYVIEAFAAEFSPYRHMGSPINLAARLFCPRTLGWVFGGGCTVPETLGGWSLLGRPDSLTAPCPPNQRETLAQLPSGGRGRDPGGGASLPGRDVDFEFLPCGVCFGHVFCAGIATSHRGLWFASVMTWSLS